MAQMHYESIVDHIEPHIPKVSEKSLPVSSERPYFYSTTLLLAACHGSTATFFCNNRHRYPATAGRPALCRLRSSSATTALSGRTHCWRLAFCRWQSSLAIPVSSTCQFAIGGLLCDGFGLPQQQPSFVTGLIADDLLCVGARPPLQQSPLMQGQVAFVLLRTSAHCDSTSDHETGRGFLLTCSSLWVQNNLWRGAKYRRLAAEFQPVPISRKRGRDEEEQYQSEDMSGLEILAEE